MSFFGGRRQTEQPAPSQTEKIPIQSGFAPQMPQQHAGFETVLGPHCSIEGKLETNGNIRIDGAFSGTLHITGNILVGESANVSADINARNISIAGTVRGNVSGKKVQLLRTAKVWGDIGSDSLTTEEGAFIDGKISMTPKEELAPTPKTTVVAHDETLEPTFLQDYSEGKTEDEVIVDVSPDNAGQDADD